MTFHEYLNIELNRSVEIFDYYLNFLSELSSKDFPYEEQIKIRGSAIKFLNCIDNVSFVTRDERDKYLQMTSNLTEELKRYLRTRKTSKISMLIFQRNISSIYKIQDLFGEYYSTTLEYINEATERIRLSDNLKLNGFFQPEQSNKKKIQDLINEAIGYIKEDISLTEKSKKQIIDYLNKALRDLDGEHTNWSKFIGRLKETVIVLGALGSLSGGITPLLQAKDKLEEATVVIQQTSINLNYNILNETFNMQNILQVGPLNSAVLQIQECNDKK